MHYQCELEGYFLMRNKCLVFAVTQVKAVVLDPRNLFSVDRTLTRDDVQRLIQVLLACCVCLHLCSMCF